MRNLRLMKISQQLKCAAIGILAIGSSNLVSVYLNSVGNDSKVVNYAGIVRGGTQRLVKLELAGKPSDKLIEKQNKLVNGLIKGDTTLELPPANDPEFQSQMQTVANAWQDLKETIIAARQDSKNKPKLLDASEKYFELANQAVFAAEKYSADKTERLRRIQILIFAASLLLLTTIWITVNKITTILENSTNDISSSADRIASVVVEQEQSIKQQALAVSKTTQIIGGLKEFAKQSTVTAEISVGRINQTISLVEKLNQSTRQNVGCVSSLMKKLATISTHINLLEKQTTKLSRIAIPEHKILGNVSINRQSIATGTIEKPNHTNHEIATLLANLQSSIAAMMMVTDDSMKILGIEIASSQESSSDLMKVIATIDYLALNNQQIFTTTKQHLSAIQQVSVLVDGLNVGAQKTSNSIAQVGVSAKQLTQSTQALETKI
jgi:methyl-accepting chemotaxis protein